MKRILLTVMVIVAGLSAIAPDVYAQIMEKLNSITGGGAESGGVSEEALKAAIDEALAEAKASGEFDGKDGVDGVDGKDGVDGADGADGAPGLDGVDGVGIAFESDLRIGRHITHYACTTATLGDVYLVVVRHIDDGTHADVVLHKCYVYGKLVIALDELHRAVQGVDKPEELPVAALLVEHRASLLREDGYARSTQRLLYGVVRHPIGDGYRRMVAL